MKFGTETFEFITQKDEDYIKMTHQQLPRNKYGQQNSRTRQNKAKRNITFSYN